MATIAKVVVAPVVIADVVPPIAGSRSGIDSGQCRWAVQSLITAVRQIADAARQRIRSITSPEIGATAQIVHAGARSLTAQSWTVPLETEAGTISLTAQTGLVDISRQRAGAIPAVDTGAIPLTPEARAIHLTAQARLVDVAGEGRRTIPAV